MYIPRYFRLFEWLPKEFYRANIDSIYDDKLWVMFDERILWTFDRLRARYGRIIMNDWWWGGDNQYRGWRPIDCPVGAELSQHKFCRAGDGVFRQSAEEVRQDILKHQSERDFQYISVIEKNVPWLHCACQDKDNVKIKLI